MSCPIELEGKNEVEVVMINNITNFNADLKIELQALINDKIKSREALGWSLEDIKVAPSERVVVVTLVFWQPRIVGDMEEAIKNAEKQ